MAQISKRSIDLGTENAFVVLAEVNDLMRKGKDIISFCIGQPDFQSPKNVQEAGIKAIREGKHGYTPSSGIPELREAICEYIWKTRRIKIDPVDVVVGAGAKPFIMYSILATTDHGHGHEVIYPNPGFPIYESQIRAMGATPVPVNLHQANNFRIDAKELKSKINNQTRLLILNSPHNPTGAIIPKSDMGEIVEVLKQFPDCWIYADEIYSQLCYDNDFVSITGFSDIKERVILTDGVSKTWAMTGWRLGFAVNSELAPIFSKWVTNTDSCASHISQWAAVEAISGVQIETEEMKRSFQKRRNLIVDLINEVPGIKCLMPGGAFYIWPDVTQACGLIGASDSEEFRKRLLDDVGVAVLADIHFGARTSEKEQHIRFSYAASIHDIEEGIRRISRYVESFK